MSLNLRYPLSRKYKEARRARLSRRGHLGVQARHRRMMERAATWVPVKEITIRDVRTEAVHVWTVSATNEDRPSLAVCVDGQWHRYTSVRGIHGLLARKLWKAGSGT